MSTTERKPPLSVLFSLIAPGLGQIYNGQPIKGILFFLGAFSLQLLVLIMGLQHHFIGMLFLLVACLSSYFLIAGEAFFTARKFGRTSLRSFTRWYYYLLFIIFALGIGSLAGNLYDIEPHKNLSGAMLPTLMMDDHIIINIKYYDKGDPSKGDVVLFKSPEDPSKYSIKRIIAAEHDTIESRDKTIYINGDVLDEPYVQHDDSTVKSKDDGPRDNFGPFTLPKGKVFVMGDNRDQSYDSRFYGFVDRYQIKGKALYIYWSKTAERIGRAINGSET